MNEKTPDRRAERTRQACLDAFIGLLLTVGYEAITVNDVIREANVGRSTFYDHFTGKEDLLRQRLAVPFSHLAALFSAESDFDALVWLVGHFRERPKMVKMLLDGTTRSLMVHSLAGLIEQRIAPGWPASPPARLPVGLAALSLAELQLGMVFHWLSVNAKECPPESLAEALRRASLSAAADFGAPYLAADSAGAALATA